MSDTRFFDWLAGFIDGEGCFMVRTKGTHFNCALTIKLREDDGAILHQIRAATGLGEIYKIAAAGTSRPQTAWQVERKADCAALVRLLTLHSLRVRKAQDFAIWSEAVSAWHQGDHTEMARLKAVLQDGRAFEPSPAEEHPADFPVPQLRLIEGDVA